MREATKATGPSPLVRGSSLKELISERSLRGSRTDNSQGLLASMTNQALSQMRNRDMEQFSLLLGSSRVCAPPWLMLPSAFPSHTSGRHGHLTQPCRPYPQGAPEASWAFPQVSIWIGFPQPRCTPGSSGPLVRPRELS